MSRHVPVFCLDANNSSLQLRKGADAARANDTTSMRAAVAHWFSDAGPPLDPESRANCRLSHTDSGRLLRPIESDWDDER